ncbi:thiamine pyrophosphate protein TPP binding domain protein [Fusobacterium sp. CAG:439]|nr:thiamine pyrophosphate protein TPP binding domain protein [Fusobacterium sp. CAG:439]HIT92663.1 rubredoxin [Candidatus Stercorousia faecigallinarum]
MKYRCDVCQWIYDEEKEGKKFADLPDDWTCPICGADKDMFSKIDE